VTLSFSQLPLIPEILSALRQLQYSEPTPIQSGAIPPLLEGKDLLGCAQTGTGKTAAFAIPIIQMLHTDGSRPEPFCPLGLILAPTRELAVQISDNITQLGKHTRVRQTRIYGGVGQRPQVAALQRGVHVLVATPGRLLDLIQQDYCSLAKLKFFVLDEADRMLDMGFMPEIQKIVRMLPRKRQSVFLSATMPPPIQALASSLLHQHVTVMVAPPATTAERVQQRVMFVERSNKRKLLDHLLAAPEFKRVLVFMRTKYGADRMYKSLQEAGVAAEGIHSGRSQNARQRVLNAFRNGEVRVLIATDVAARGIDVDNISHVINFEIPLESDSYVHRIGRTARAGAAGESISFCDGGEYRYLKAIENQIGDSIPVDRDHPFHSVDAEDEELRQHSRTNERKHTKPRVPSRKAKSSNPRSSDRTGKGSNSSSRSEGSNTKILSKRRDDRAMLQSESRGQGKTTATADTKRRRSISGKIKKIKNQDGFTGRKGKRARPKTQQRSGRPSR
jgi:ATP-dependent RNA helicase RhlE